ncbi:MAG: FG-GAP-like repeat-containing protein [Bacteroidia bacterium]|nr:FG-GAP-like repeat-containing protein [Bacteroidia bacterium]MCF8428015.1 FG-GAP-like repeat-containing protein [Bacteroidia bacterium]MCF8445739.1 FG-GAP-like repeat-containing protein [Bacteroidia bacterium]
MLKKLLFATLILANFSAYSQQFPNSIGSSKLPSANGMILDVVDYNNDGFEDVVYQNGLSGNIELYRNLNGEFTAVTNSALLPIIPGVGDGSEGVISFDYNNDGFQDLLIMSSGPTGYMRLFKNNCGVNFIEVTTDVNLPSTPNFIPQYLTKDPMVFISDYDKDNDNDIIFCRDSVSKFWITVLKNNAGSFDLPQNLITSFNSTEIPNIALFDFDNFGGEDILIIKNTGISNSCEMVLYQNNGGGVFTVVSGTTGLTNSSPIGFANILDLNADGYSDILLGTKEVVNPGPGNLGNKIFLNNSGDGTFTDITGLVNTSSSTAGDYTRAHIFDIENDGDQDILWEINSNTLANSVPALMSSNGAGVFSNIASLKIAAASSTSSYTGKYVIFDYNNDGAMDIFQPGSAAGPARLFRNNNVSNKFLGVRLLSCNGQADPIGAKVYVKAGAISTYKSYNTQGITSTTTGKSERLNFGLDTNSVIDSLIVFWPNNNIDILTNISSNQNLTLYDGVCEIGKPLVFDLGADTFNVCGQDTGYVLAPSGYVNYSWSTGELTDLAKITQKGWYFCTVTNVEGCNATDSIFVAFGNASIVQADATICFGDMVTLDANPRYDCSPFGAPKKRPALQGGEDIGPDYIYVGTNNGHHYYKLRNPDNWTQSAKLANDAGGYLAVITSQEEQDFLGNHPDLNGMNLWIGLHKDNSGGQFRWMNCEEFVYNNWATGQSAPTPGVDDNYVYMRTETCVDPRGWKNRDENQSSPDPCESNIFGLVEFDASTNISYLWSTGDTTATIITSPTSTTSVGVRITQNDANCFAFVNVNVINPNDQFASDTLSECKASFIQIQAKPGMSSYSWSTGGSTSSIFVPASGADRWYSVDVVTPEGCIGSDSVYVQLYNTSIKTPDTAVCLGTTVYLRGPNAPYSYSPDYSYNFTSPPFSEFGSNNSILFNGSRVLGPFANDSVTYFMSGLPLHDSIRVTFDLLIHDTWDGNCSVNGPDEFRFKNGATNILNTTFSNTPGCTQNYSSGGGSGTFPATTGAAVTGLPKRCDNNGVTTLYTITKSFSHTAADLDLSWVGLLREATSDICFESWSLDNVIIEVRKPGNLEWSTGDFEQNIFVTPVDPVTEYWVKIPLGNSYCYDTVVVSTFIGQIPGKIFGTDTARYCGSDYANYSLPPNYDKYTWSNGDNNRVSQFYNTGWYTGYIENTTGCYGSDSIYIDLGGATMIPNTDTTVCYGNPLLLRADLNNDCSPFGAPAKSGYTAGSTIPGYTYIGDYRGHSYFLADVNSSWSIAAQNALQAGGYLVNINDTAEQKFIEDNVDRNIWTGLHMGEDGWMVWMNCDTLTYTNWAPGEPTATPNDYVFMSNSTCPEPHKWRAHTDDDQTNPDPCLSNIFGLLEITEYSYVHNWYENFNLISNSDSLWLLPTADARYFGTVATSPGAANCGIGSIVVTVQNEFFDILPDSVEKINCEGDTVMIEAKAGYSNYNWDNGETTQIAVYKDLVGWAYCMYDNGVCQFKDSVYVNVPAKFEGNPSLTDITCFGSNDGVAVAGILGGTFPYDILWAHNGSTQINEPNLGPGVYYYTVTDINGCNITDSVIITNPPSPLNVTFSVLNPVTCNSDTNAMILPIPEGGSPLYSGTWFGLPYTDTLMNVGAGIYNYSVTDSRGCVVSIDYEITQPEKLNLFTTQIKQIFCPEDSNGVVFLNATGGVQPYQFIWGTNLLIGDTAFKVYNGQVLAIVVDQNFCYDTVTFDMQPTNTDPDKCGLVVPSGFTPNGDGMNDLFYIKGLTDFPDNELTVFNRWGETVYHAVNYKNNWDGKPEKNTLLGGNDGIVPNDTYFYIFVTKANNKTHTGYVYITK